MPQPATIDNPRFDLIVVGAGCNGTGIARDAAMRGLRVLLLDKGDLGGETTSWSSRLIHGGLRYLEHGQLGLVAESLRERRSLLRNAAHLVRPLSMLIPIYRGVGKAGWKIRLGMIGYDLLSIGKKLPAHRMLSRRELLGRAAGLNPHGLKGGALYYDAQVEYPERLVVENALSARSHGATIRTYCRVERFLLNDGHVNGVVFTDSENGIEHTARAPVTVNATGPWVDQLLDRLGQPTPRLLERTKGSHLVVDPFPGAPNEAVYTEAADGRPIFILPWLGRHLVGTTDTRFDGDAGAVRAQTDEVEYLLDAVNRVIPAARLDRSAVRYTYAGVRPLAYSASDTTGAITRRHFVRHHAPAANGLLSVVGGKLTTYRSLAEQVVDKVFDLLETPAPPCTTSCRPLPGSDPDWAAFSDRFLAACPLPARVGRHLLTVYGRRATEVLSLVRQDPALAAPLDHASAAIGAEIIFAFRYEMAHHLCDAIYRRSMIGLDPSTPAGVLDSAASVAERYLGWNADQRKKEIERCHRHAHRFSAIDPANTEDTPCS